MKNDINTPSIARNVNTLESLFAFKGETISKAGDVTVEESIRLGVALIQRGEESKARGIFVLADKAKSMPTVKDLETFRESLKSEMVNSAVNKAIALLGDGASAAALEKAKTNAREEAGKRFDNLGQTMRAAQFMLANPGKVADGISVFTVQQANAYLEAPKAKDDKPADPAKLLLHNTVAKLLKKPGVSQGAIKTAVSEVKAKLAKEAEEATKAADKRSDADKLRDAQQKQMRDLVFRSQSMLSLWDELLKAGVKAEELRGLSVTVGDASKGTLASNVRDLAKLAGLEVK